MKLERSRKELIWMSDGTGRNTALNLRIWYITGKDPRVLENNTKYEFGNHLKQIEASEITFVRCYTFKDS